AAAGDLLPGSEFREAVLDLFRPRSPEEGFGASFARLLFAMFGEDGLCVIEPRDLPASAFRVLPDWFARADEIRGRVRSSSEHLSDLGFDVTLDPGTTLMFTSAGGRRQALADGEGFGAAADLSPGVLLRPLWQDAVLPTLGFVVGPGELAYLAVVTGLYKLLGVPRPVFVPRASLTLVERSLVKQLDRFGGHLPDLAAGPAVLAKAVEVDGESPPEAALRAAIEELQGRLSGIGGEMRSVDATMLG